MKKRIASLVIATGLLITAGCTNATKSNGDVVDAMENLINSSSYTFQSNANLHVTVPDQMMNQEVAPLAAIVDNVDVSIEGIYVKDPQQYELDMNIQTTGDVGFNFHLPVIITKDKLWVKIPSNYAGMFGMNGVGNKFYEIDLEDGETMAGLEMTPADAQKLGLQIARIFVDEYNGTLLKSVNTKEAGLDGTDVQNLTRLSVANKDIEQVMTIGARKVSPRLLELLTSAEWKDKVDLSESDIADFKENTDVTDEEIEKAASEFDDYIHINNFTSDIGTNKKNEIVYATFSMDVDIVDSNLTDYEKDKSTGNIIINSTTTFNNFGEKPVFKFGIPNEEDIVRE